MNELLQVWSPLGAIILAPIITFTVQKVKKHGINPLFFLAIVSSFFALIYSAMAQYVAEEVLHGFVSFAIMVGGVANLIYSVLKKYTDMLK